MLLWLWWRLAATAPIAPLAWEPPYARGTALKDTYTHQKKKKTSIRLAAVSLPDHSAILPLEAKDSHHSFSEDLPCVKRWFRPWDKAEKKAPPLTDLSWGRGTMTNT